MQAQYINQWRVPYGFEIWGDGVYSMDYPDRNDADAEHQSDQSDQSADWQDVEPTLDEAMPHSRRALVSKRLTTAPIWLEGFGHDLDDEQQHFVRVACRHASRWFSAELLSNRNLIGKLAALGYPIDASAILPVSRFLMGMLNLNTPLRQPDRLAQRIGFHETPEGRGWLLRDTWIGPKAARVEMPFASAPYLVRGLVEQGELGAWLDRFRKINGEAPTLARWLVALSFAAPIMRIAGYRTFIVHHWGDSGFGKTAIANFAQSVWGHPKNFTASFNSTKLAMVEQFKHLTDLPICFNELQAASYRGDLADLIYQIAEEAPRQRLDRSGIMQATGSRWRALVRFTGEQPLIDTMHDLGGQRNRIIELRAEALSSQQAFDLHRWMESKDAAFGVAGPAYLRALVGEVNKHPDRLSDLAFQFETEILKRLGKQDARAAHFAIVALGQALAFKTLFGMRWSLAREGAIRDATEVANLANVGEERVDQLARVIAIIEESIASGRVADLRDLRARSFFAERQVSDFDVIIEPGRVYERYTGDWLWTSSKFLRQAFANAGYPWTRARDELERAGLITKEGGQYSTRRHLNGAGQVRVVAIAHAKQTNNTD